jgi:hypothetical protein
MGVRSSLKLPKSLITSLPLRGGLIPLTSIAPIWGIPIWGRNGSAVPPPIGQFMKTLQLRLHRVDCLDETGSILEWGSDEIYLGANTIDESGDTETIAIFKVGNFDDGDAKVYSPPRVFATFDVREGDAWPKSYFVNFLLSEVDWGDTAEFLNSLTDKLKEWVTNYAQGKGPLTGTIVGYALGKIVDWLKGWWGDDIFNPVTVTVELPSANSRWDGSTISPRYVESFSGHDGRYQVVYDWRLTDPSPLVLNL